jgi:hypothetical protein
MFSVWGVFRVQMSYNIRIIAAYAGTGKTTLAALYPDKVVDFVCMPYKYHLSPDGDSGEAGKGNPDNEMREEWPHNYIEAIKLMLCEDKILLIPTDLRVLSLLIEENIPYILCYPHRNAKDMYRQRFIDRGNTEDFLYIFVEHWDYFINKLDIIEAEKRIILESHQFLSDVKKKKNRNGKRRYALQ